MKKLLLSLMAFISFALNINAGVVTFNVNDPELWGVDAPESGKGTYITSAENPNVSVTKDGVTITTKKEEASTNSVVWNTNDVLTFRSYKNSKLVISSDKEITGIEINGVSGKLLFSAEGLNISGATATWSGKSESVEFSFSGTSQIISISVTYGNSTVDVEGVSLTDAEGNALTAYTSLTVTDKLQLKAVVSPSDATNKKVTWEVMQDAEVISLENGLVTALAPGKAAVVVTTEDGEYQAATTFIVSEIQDATIAEFLEAKGKTCYLTGTVSAIDNTVYGNYTLTDESGSIYVYGTLTPEGDKKQFASLNVQEGDKIKVLAREYENYKGTEEAKDVVFVENYGQSPETPVYTFDVAVNGNDFTITPSDENVNYYVGVYPAEIDLSDFGFETFADYFDHLFGEMGEGLEYFDGVSTQNLVKDWYVDPEESINYLIVICAVDENYKRISDVSITNITYGAEPTSYALTIGETYYATFYDSKHAYIMPEDCQGYVFTATEGFDLAYEEGETVPAGEPLVILNYMGETGTFNLQFTTSTEDTFKSAGMNELEGTDEETQLADDSDSYFYALSLNAEKDPTSIGFYWMNETGAAFKNGAHKAYLKLPKTSAAKSAYLFNDDVTAIKNVNAETTKPVRKALVNGQLVIKTANGTFSAAGAQMK